MAEVYEVARRDSSRRYALKIVHASHCAHPSLLKRFEREVRLAQSLDHPNLVPVLEHGVNEGRPWCLMPLVEDLDIDRIIRQEGPLNHEAAHAFMCQVLRALACMHSKGFCHRDIKPENVLYDGERVYLSDLGLALEMQEDEARLTQHNSPLGTPGFMPPEQWRGQSIGPCGDVFGAGALGYYLISGKLPYPGKNAAECLTRLLSGEMDPLPPGVPEPLIELLQRALAVEPADRFQDASEFLSEWEKWSPTPRKVVRLFEGRQQTLLESPQALLQASSSSSSSPHHPTVSESSMSSTSSDRVATSSNLGRAASSELRDARKLAMLPVEFAQDSFWVGKRNPGEIFYANPYLRCFKGGGEAFNLLIDPGSSADFSVVQAKCSRLMGDMSKLSAIFINHQDPDVASSVGIITGRHAPNAYTMCTEDTWRLVQYHNISRERFLALEKYPKGFSLPTGDWLLPVPSPFCHFVGAMMLYDPQTRVLYTGDLFGALTSKDAQGLWADESDWLGMRAFHQIYMPTRKALQHAIHNIEQIQGEVEVIAPQHGRLLRGEWIKEFMGRLNRLPVGLDIITDRMASKEELSAWSNVLERGVASISALCEHDLRAAIHDSPELKGLVEMRGNKLDIVALGKFTVEHALRVVADLLQDADLMSMMKYEVIFATNEFDLPTPSMEIEEEGENLGGGSMLGSVGI